MTTRDDDENNALATRPDDALVAGGARSADAYEAQYMKGQGVVLHRAKERAPKVLQVALISPAVLSLPLLALGWAGVLAVAFTAPMFLILWALFSVLRTTVSEGEVRVQYGLFGPTIPVAAIHSAEATTYDWKKFGGWGIRRSSDGEWIYNMPGDRGRAVRIVWTDGSGNRKVTLIGSKAPQELAAAIATAQQRALAAGRTTAALTEDLPE